MNLTNLRQLADRYQRTGRTGMVVGTEVVLEMLQQIERLERKCQVLNKQKEKSIVPQDKMKGN